MQTGDARVGEAGVGRAVGRRGRVIRGWAAVALVLSVLVGVPAPAGAQAATCFGRTPTITDNGPGDQDPRPFVVVDFESSPAWQKAIELVIENIGTTVAANVTLEFDPPLESADKMEGAMRVFWRAICLI